MIVVVVGIVVVAAVLVLAFTAGLRFGYVKAERDIALRELRELRGGRG